MTIRKKEVIISYIYIFLKRMFLEAKGIERGNKMRKAVFFDIDGTLWNQNYDVSQSTRDAIAKLRENGHLAFICSGRSRANIKSEKLLSIGFDGVVASCGAHVDFHKETIFEKLLTAEQVAHILEVSKQYAVPIIFEGPQYMYANPEDFLDDAYVVYLREEQPEDLKVIPDDPALIVANKYSGETIGVDMESYQKELGDEFDVVVHIGEDVFEVIPSGYSKATGIKVVCEKFGIAIEDTYCFGDGENDLEMLRFAGHGIAMGNGTVNAKAAADFVTTGVDEDGIYNGLKHFGLI